MALDLFINYERASNSSTFFRATTEAPYTATIRLSDTANFEANFSTVYYAESSLNNGPFTPFNITGLQGEFITRIDFNTTSPCVCSVSVNVSSVDTRELYLSAVLSGIFISTIPVAEVIAYPKQYINEQTNQLVELSSTNFLSSPGVYFYGEGHSETIMLSSNAFGQTANWFIGNDLNSINAQSVSVLPVTKTSNETATVLVTSAPADSRKYSIDLFVTTGAITLSSPIFTYSDEEGLASRYPYYFSSAALLSTSNTEDSITVRPYKDPSPFKLTGPFQEKQFNLPWNYNSDTFRGVIKADTTYEYLTSQFIGSQWRLYADSEYGSWEMPQTSLLQSTYAYQFDLTYDTTVSEYFLLPLKASPASNTTVTLECSAIKKIRINLANDWLPRTTTTIFSAQATINPIPFPNLYIPNYFNLKNQPVEIMVSEEIEPSLKIEKIVITSPSSPDTLVLSGTNVFQLSGLMLFDKLGPADLSAVAVMMETTPTNGSQQAITYSVGILFDNALEIVPQFDDEPNEDYFQSSLTPLKLTYPNQPPLLTPNEWATSDNINDVIQKIYTTIDDLDDYTKLYTKKQKFYGWLAPRVKQSIWFGLPVRPDRPLPPPVYTWIDLECPTKSTLWSERNLLDDPGWEMFESLTPELSSELEFTWQYHDCGKPQPDPSCLQKYCLEWSWKAKKKGAEVVDVTWANSKSTGTLPKTWAFEKCKTEVPPLNCDRDTWKISTIDPEWFPIPSSFATRCTIADVELSEFTNQIIIGYPTELQLINTNYSSTPYLARAIKANDFYNFYNIVGLASNKLGKVFVLDDELSLVTVFEVINDRFKLFSSWGGYGKQSTPNKFNKPQDIHVDEQGFVWVADTGNNCIKKFTSAGKHVLTIVHEKIETNSPLSVSLDSKLNLHCLTSAGVVVFDEYGQYIFEYLLPNNITEAKKINSSYNREMLYITHNKGVLKYFRTGVICHELLNEVRCSDNRILQEFNSICQDKFRNVYVAVNDKILKIPDLQKLKECKAPLSEKLYWSLSDLLIGKEEYIQPWVYLKSFNRLWDNIELLRSSLFYETTGCKSFTKPAFTKEEIVIGQNEIVSNAVVNRIISQLWTNLQPLINYFDPNCEN